MDEYDLAIHFQRLFQLCVEAGTIFGEQLEKACRKAFPHIFSRTFHILVENDLMIHDFQKNTNVRRCKVFDAATGQEIRFVFYLNTETGRLGRYEGVILESDFSTLKTTFDVASQSNVPVEIWEDRKVRIEWADEADVPVLVGG
jgi:hypothetical protein